MSSIVMHNSVHSYTSNWHQNAARAAFFIGGFGAAAWAPLVPLLKDRLMINENVMGLLLLCIGMGSLITMPISGIIAAKFGCRKVIVTASLLYAFLLILLSEVTTLPATVAILILFGAAMGMIDVTANIQALSIEKAIGHRLMSSMHGFWSVGGFLGASIFGIWIDVGLSPFQATLCAAIIMILTLIPFIRYLLNNGGDSSSGAHFAFPRGIVSLIAIIICISFLVEGSIMDWGGIYLTTIHRLDISLAGTGFALYSGAMLIMRLTGDWLLRKFSTTLVIFGGMLLTIVGFLLIIASSWQIMLYLGFFLIGAGFANVVPVFYSLLAKQKIMPLTTAISAVSTFGYLGILMGPAVIGFIAHLTSLISAFTMLVVLLIIEIFVANYVYKKMA